MTSGPLFVLVGHCGPDFQMLKAAISRAVPGAVIHRADDDAAVQAHAGCGAILLVNRVLDGGFDESDGVALIRRLNENPGAPRAMLVSNHADAQRQAQQAGALPGFGKAALHAPHTAETLRRAAGLA